MNNKKTMKICVILCNVFLVILFCFAIALPWLVTWYVKITGREDALLTTVMVTCYPCVPFAAAALLYLRRVLKNALKGEAFSQSSTHALKNLSFSCLVISVITLVAGRFYLPFYIVGATFAFLALLVFSLKGIFASAEKE
ncbi:MAG: hypothetical protein IJD55_05625 [Clostridia bacterium]|nr:hypothetical protein [Clostridia bacterium]